MKQPNTENLKVNKSATKKIRAEMAAKQSVKITINIDAKTLDKLRALSDDSGVPYQRLINKLLAENLEAEDTTNQRLERLEAEMKKIKRKLAA